LGMPLNDHKACDEHQGSRKTDARMSRNIA